MVLDDCRARPRQTPDVGGWDPVAVTGTGTQVDHVVMGVADLDEAAAWLASRGLTALRGGTHPQWGTAHRIVPLGDGVVVMPGHAGLLAAVPTTPSDEITLRPPLTESRP